MKKALDSPYVEFLGFHFHIGSQLFEKDPYLQALNVTLKHIKNIKEKYGAEVEEINMGGGFGVVYTDEQRKPYSYYLDPLMERINEFFVEEQMQLPAVVIEPGRSIVAEAGITLYTIGRIKDIPGVRKYVSTDGGMTDNIRPALYQSEYDGIIAGKASQAKTEKVTVCGKCCESGDILIRDIDMAEPETGDIFAIFSTGAYGYSMASNYNRNPVSAVVLVKEGRSEVIVKRQTYENMISNDVIPDSLR